MNITFHPKVWALIWPHRDGVWAKWGAWIGPFLILWGEVSEKPAPASENSEAPE